MGLQEQAALSSGAVARRVDDYVAARLLERRGAGIALGVVRDGKLVRASGYGLADVELCVPVKPETVFEIGSLSKQFTAAAVMMLVEAGSVKLDDTLPTYFPEAPEAWKDITLRQLLTHTSGLPDYGADKKQEGKKGEETIDFRKDYTEEELLKKLFTLKSSSSPGEKFDYSNTNYVLLGILIHQVTGKPYGDFLSQRIFKPLGMSATRLISESDIIPHRARGYRLVDGELKNQEWVAPSLNTTADGGLYSNVLDLAKWDAALSTEVLLGAATLQQIWTPVTLKDGKTAKHGFGWHVTRWNGHRLLRHAGEWQGFTAAICRFPDDHLTVIALTNLYEKGAQQNVIALTAAGLYLPDLLGLEKARAACDKPTPGLAQLPRAASST